MTVADIAEEVIDLGRSKVDQERAAALYKFAETEKLDIETQRQHRVLEPSVRKETAEARLKELEVLRAELAFLEDMKKAGAVIRVEKDGSWTVLPSPPQLDLIELADPKLLNPPEAPVKAPHRTRINRLRQLRTELGLMQNELARLAKREQRVNPAG